jgi:hypothetical protein
MPSLSSQLVSCSSRRPLKDMIDGCRLCIIYQYLIFFQLAASLIGRLCNNVRRHLLRHPQLHASREIRQKNNGGGKHKKLTAQPHARAGSMEVDGYENPAAENRVLLLEGGVEPMHSFDLRRGPPRMSPQYRWAKHGCFRSLGGGGGCWNAGPCIYGVGGKVREVELGWNVGYVSGGDTQVPGQVLDAPPLPERQLPSEKGEVSPSRLID